MTNLIDPIEISQDWESDLTLSVTGDLATVSLLPRSQKRVMRRLMTPPGSYIFHPTYGGGLGSYVGQPVDIAKVTAVIVGQMRLEASVAKSPAPTVVVTPIPQGLMARIGYFTAPEGTPAVLSFSLTP